MDVQQSDTGLYFVPTPIGNLQDMTFRAIEVLKNVDVILSEDTRKTGILLKHFDIGTKMMSYHKFNEHQQTQKIIDRILVGEKIALVTDAGTPGISDPGFLLVRACVENEIKTECLPGATAFVPAIVNSGLPSEKFCFEGFLPQKKGKQKAVLSLVNEERTMVFYESPYRLLKTLSLFAEMFGGDRKASVSREITKIHEENIHGTLEELIEYYSNNTIKGEIVIVVEGNKGK